MATEVSSSIKALDATSVHRISSGQVVIDLQTAVKELVENSLDAGATSIEVRFKDHGLASIEVVDNGSGIAPEDYDAIGLKHHTSKLSSFTDLTLLRTFGFRGEALSSLCALCEQVSVTTATANEAPMGSIIELDRAGRVVSKQGKVARQRGTTVLVTGLFKPLPVRRKELERNAKREFSKALALLSAYALVPCAQENKGVRLTVTHLAGSGKKSVQMRTNGAPSTRASVTALWGPKALEQLVDLDIRFGVETERAVLRRRGIFDDEASSSEVRVRGLISKFAVGCGRTSSDRQFFFINGRPCSPSKVQKAFNEVYRTFNANQAPFIVADFILPTDSCDVNVSPDKRTILLHSESNLVQSLKIALEQKFAPSRATYDINASSSLQTPLKQGSQLPSTQLSMPDKQQPLFLEDGEEDNAEPESLRRDTLIDRNGGCPIGQHESDSFGEPTLLLRHTDSNDVQDAPTDVLLASYEAPIAAYPTLGDHGSEELSSLAQGVQRVSARHIPGVDLGDQDQDREIVVSEPPGNDDELSLSATQLRDATADPGSPSANQVPPRPEVSGHHEGRVRIESATERSSMATAARSMVPGRYSPSCPIEEKGSRKVQTVLSTSGASWNLHQRSNEDPTPPFKRRRIEDSKVAKEGKGASQELRTMLKPFANGGSQTVDVDLEEVETEGSEGSEDSEERREIPERKQERRQADRELSVEADDMDVDRLPSSQVDGMVIDHDDAEISAELPWQDNIYHTTDVGPNVPRESTPLDTSLGTPTASTSSTSKSSRASRLEVVRSTEDEDVSLRFDSSRVSSSWKRLQAWQATDAYNPPSSQPIGIQRDAGIANAEDDAKAAEALSLVIDKTDFASMEIVGQFNLGFIIARRHTSPTALADAHGNGRGHMDDLFIVDQHAADEKYNFETLQQTTEIISQKLIRPQPLELTAADEILATENLDVLKRNGFEIDIDDDATFGDGHRLKLCAQPISENTVFDVKDLEELLHLLQDRPTGQMVRCSKARAMFAMRACRKSVMIGMALDRRQMTSVVRHMGMIDQPWNCPHGRPTMRHLSDISRTGGDWWKGRRHSIDWVSFGNQ